MSIESEHVHLVYDLIATHFSATRYKPWPVIVEFLASQEDGSLGTDVGCGNGKYINVNPNVFLVGSDRSPNLIQICADRGFNVLVADNLDLPFRSNAFSFAISIAVIHHFSTPERRLQALEELLRVVSVGGTILVYVWALEQSGKRQFDVQDVFVPWKMPKEYPQELVEGVNVEEDREIVYQRYYHLFIKGELEGLVSQTNATILTSGFDRDNHYVILQKN